MQHSKMSSLKLQMLYTCFNKSLEDNAMSWTR